MDAQYTPARIEAQAQQFWEEHNCFHVAEDISREKFYCLSMFPYPSGNLHMGHVRNYTIGDMIARYQRQLGKNVLQPMGWDAFGLPAENAAIKHGIPPGEWTRKNISHMRSQLKQLGLAIDWQREIATCDPRYYRWEQWFFLQLYKKGLVYRKNAEVNWDPVDQTILANEQVVDGRGWRSGALVERREIPQWFLKITAFADELLTDLAELPEWPEQVKTMQRNWIGRSEGILIHFPVKQSSDSLTVFTTRPDTLFGAAFVAIAPQHPLALAAATGDAAVQDFIAGCRNIKVAEADLATLEKRGVPTAYQVIHPLTGEALPVWVANFVLMAYGEGAVMAVPAHDVRDFEFAQHFDLPVKPVVLPEDRPHDFDTAAFTSTGRLTNSGEFTGLSSVQAATAIADALEQKGAGKRCVHYRLRDWSISRQRYWGTPIPFVYCDDCGTVPVPENQLPVRLPDTLSFAGNDSSLKRTDAFFKTDCPACGKPALRETDTFDTFFESSWYYARYACPTQDQAMLDSRVNYWLPVDHYIGGIEHAVMHLLYARFIHKAMRDEGLVNSDEPFTRLLTQGMVLNQGIKMSKSKGNTVDPGALIERYGADTARLFVIFAAPPTQSLEWSDSGMEGAHRFLKKLWHLAFENREHITQINNRSTLDETCPSLRKASEAQQHALHQLYQLLEQIRTDYARLQFNTVVSGCMKLLNLLQRLPEPAAATTDIRAWIRCHGFGILLRVLSPVAPHITHHLWQALHYPGFLIHAPWPKNHAAACRAAPIGLVIQIDGKKRTQITVPADADRELIEQLAAGNTKVLQAIQGRTIKKMITIPGRLVNIVTADK